MTKIEEKSLFELKKHLITNGWYIFCPKEANIVDVVAFRENYPVLFVKYRYEAKDPNARERRFLNIAKKTFNGVAYFIGDQHTLDYHLEILDKQFGYED